MRTGVVGQAVSSGLISIATINPRSFTHDTHHTVDDRPFGGGDGMIMMAQPLAQSVESVVGVASVRPPVIHLSPRGRRLTDAKARELARSPEIVLVATRYGGADQRFLNEHVNEEISIGDYVLSGGELPALVLIDAIARLVPGVLGNHNSSLEESFAHDGLLEYPQFTRPRIWRCTAAPEELLSGNHRNILTWKKIASILVTADRRPDLLIECSLTQHDLLAAKSYLGRLNETETAALGLGLAENIIAVLDQELRKRE